MEFSEKVIILHVGRFKESDIWLRILSPTHGILSVFAFGGSRSRQRFVGCLDIFNTVLFRVKLSRRSGYYSVEEGVLVKGVSRLREDWNRLGIAKNCSSFIQAFGVDSDGAASAYRLFTDTLEYLETADSVQHLFPLFFRMRFAAEQGYKVDVQQCHQCGTAVLADGAFLFVRDGVLLCPSCSRLRSGVSVALGQDSLKALAIVQDCPPALWGQFDKATRTHCSFSPAVQQECGRAIDKFIEFHVGLRWDNGRFKKV